MDRKDMIFSSLGSEMKFRYTILERHPQLLDVELDFNRVFYLFFKENGRFTLYFYISFVNFLINSHVDFEICKSVLRYAARSSLFNRNAIYMMKSDSYVGFFRKDDEIFGFTASEQELKYLMKEYGILKEYGCYGFL
ncbi:hypothetical protein JEQ21_05495 [Streptococcus sp. 121]|uniref:hypothetical protein n=1 Tax=Streptococcus sp. 121 TaxID=2797637 RepID=UPI0018F07E32|nr:hypothetical protein [Streptococcus sp. 121]MBJ6745911.1 hypothetical protein [Streptococcus sp. 121]